MPRSVPRSQAPVSRRPTSRSDLTLYQVVRYDPATHKALEIVPVEAETKAEAAQKVCGFKVTVGPPRSAIAGVTCLGDAPKQREYFRKA